MIVHIPDTCLEEAQLTEAQVKLELAVWMYQQEYLTMAQAARLAGCTGGNCNESLPDAKSRFTMASRN